METSFSRYERFLRILKYDLKFVDFVNYMLQLKFLEGVCVHAILNTAWKTYKPR